MTTSCSLQLAIVALVAFAAIASVAVGAGNADATTLLPLRLAAPPRAVPVSTPSLAARSSREFCSDPGSAAQRIQAKLAAHFSVS